jgi:nucleoprotein TPR
MDHIQKLREDLAQAQKVAEDFRTTASVNASIANAPTEDGSKPIADQVAEHVEAIRADLEARHNERVKAVDETLQKRTDVMKANLTKKLTEGKSQIRQSLAAEHEQALQALKTEHEHEIERLRVRHKDELEELKRLDKEQHATQTANGESNVESEGGTPRGPWQPSEAEIRTLAASNDVLRTILRKNVNTQVTKAKEELSTRLNEEHEKALKDRIAEVQTKAKSAQEHAVMMEGKKTALQVNLASNKLKIAQFKLDLVDKAAKETPQKAVVEVWTNVKDAKPLTQPANVASPPQQDAAKAQKPPMAMTAGQPNPFAQNAAQQKPPTTAQPQPNPFAQNAFQQPPPITQNQTNPFVGATTQHKGREGALQVQPNPFSPNTSQDKPTQAHGQLQQPSGVSTFGRPTPATSPPPSSPRGQQSPSQQAKSAQQPAATSNTSQSPTQQAPSSQQTSNTAPKHTQGTANHHPNPGTGPGALRGLQQSGLPMARGGSIRGGGSVRGRGSGIPRGGPQAINTRGGPGPQAGRGSPTSNLNAGAKQFVPGNKRPRDEPQEGQQGGDGSGKRIRGGGGGS